MPKHNFFNPKTHKYNIKERISLLSDRQRIYLRKNCQEILGVSADTLFRSWTKIHPLGNSIPADKIILLSDLFKCDVRDLYTAPPTLNKEFALPKNPPLFVDGKCFHLNEFTSED